MPNTATLMLLPDDTYREARPHVKDPHLSVAGFGSTRFMMRSDIERLKSTVNLIARQFDPVEVAANGVGLFDAGRDGFALVDLIDGIGTFKVRQIVENLYGGRGAGLRVDYTHGFTPHMTRRYYCREDDFYFAVAPEDVTGVEFTLNKVALWAGEERYEVQL
jgi:2'-5' RNA ligase